MSLTLCSLRYLESNLLLAVWFLLMLGIQGLGETSRGLRHRHLLKVARLIMLTALSLPFIYFLLPKPSFLIASAQIWAGPTMKHAAAGLSPADTIMTVGSSALAIARLNGPVVLFSSVLVAIGLVVWLSRYGIAAYNLLRFHRRSYRIRKYSRVEVRVSDHITIPFSIWIPFRSYVYLPSFLVGTRSEFMIALRHELQHHRQSDTRWAHVLEAFRCLFFVNPFSHLLLRSISRIQEFACDEALVDQKNVSPQAYGGCLLKVAITARDSHPMLAGTTCMAVRTSGTFLKRRIKLMLSKQKRYLNWPFSVFIGIMTFLFMVTVAWASQGLVQDRRVTLKDAENLAQVAGQGGFPITINEEVVRELNRFVGTPDGREFIKNALLRMENYRSLVTRKIDEYNLPRELMALPIVESGYQNLPQSPRPMHSAGVWQFTPQTARNYGMRVDVKVDERLNVERATDAACRYLGALNLRFQNWELAILAYNAGEHKVQAGKNHTGSANAWAIINAGYGGDSGYLPRMIAAILIMNSPSIVE